MRATTRWRSSWIALLCFVTAQGWLFAATATEAAREGFALYKRQQYRQAIQSWRVVLKDRGAELTVPERAKVFKAMARAYGKLGDAERARKSLAEAERLAPRGRTLSEALAALDEALLLERTGAGKGRETFLELLPIFEKAVAKGDDPARVRYGLGTALFYGTDRVAEAEGHLKESLRLSPDEPRACLQLAKLYERTGDLPGEIAALDGCARGGLDTVELSLALAIAHGRRNEPQEHDTIITHAGKAIDDSPANGAVIIDRLTDEALKREIAALVAKAEEARRKAEEAAAKKKTVIVKYFGGPG